MDRILRQQKAERQAAEEARQKANAALIAQSGTGSSVDTLLPAQTKGAPPLPPKDALIDHHDAPGPSEETSKSNRPMSTIRQSLDFLKRKKKGDDAGPSDAPPSLPPISDGNVPLLPPPSRPDRPRTPNPHATPKSSISECIFGNLVGE